MRIPWEKLRRGRADERSAASGRTDVSPDSPFLPLFDDEPLFPAAPSRDDRLEGLAAPSPLPQDGAQPATPPAPVTPAPPARPRRRGLIPRWVPWTAAGVAAALVLVTILVLVFARTDRVRVPSLEGLDRATAERRVKGLGLRLAVGDRRFSDSVPAGSILDQTPAAGAVVEEGSLVRVALSAGSEVFGMPDVLGQDLDAARKRLRDRGLAVEFETAPSDAEQGTVIASVPSPGADVRTGDTVRLTVAAGADASGSLVPTDLTGKTFVIDPEPMPSGFTTDTPLDMARRLRALLEASGARVIVTRSVTDTTPNTTSAVRLRRAREASATALIGLTVAASGVEGIQVSSPSATGTAAPNAAASLALARSMADGLRPDHPELGQPGIATDAVLTGAGVPGVRVRLGTTAGSADRLAFMDPQWAERISRSLYSALAKSYGGR